MFHGDNSRDRYGSARFADENDLRRGGYFKGVGLPLGFYNHKPLNFNTDAPLCLIGGSGSGKLTGLLARIVCTNPQRQFILDLKGELTAISIDTQVRYKKHHYVINPYRKHSLPFHKVNPLDILQENSTTLTADCKLIVEFIIPSKENDFWINRAKEWLAKLLEWQVLKNGNTDLIKFYRLVNAVDGDITTWSEAIADGEQSNRVDIKRTFNEMRDKQINVPKEFSGVMSCIYNALDFLSDKNISDTLNGESDFSLSALCQEQNCNVSLIIPAEKISSLGAFMRLIIGVTSLYKNRNPATPKILFILDEAAQLGNFAMLRQMMSYGRGAGIQAFPVFQDTGQIVAHHGHTALQTFLGSAETRIFMGVREAITAQTLCSMLGTQTLEYDDHLRQERAKRDKMVLVQSIADGGDIFEGLVNMRLQNKSHDHPNKQQRDLMTPAEILNMPSDRMIIFTGKDCPPIYAQKLNYFDCSDMAGLYFPNPYHLPANKVRIKAWHGKAWRDIIETAPPHTVRDYPQYKNRPFRYVAGFKP